MRISRFQRMVQDWFDQVLGGTIHEPTTRVHAFRVLEEAVEIAQALGLTRRDAQRQVDYTYDRPVGDNPPQECAQLLINLVHLTEHLETDLEYDACVEFDRIDTPEVRARILDKQAFKKAHGLY